MAVRRKGRGLSGSLWVSFATRRLRCLSSHIWAFRVAHGWRRARDRMGSSHVSLGALATEKLGTAIGGGFVDPIQAMLRCRHQLILLCAFQRVTAGCGLTHSWTRGAEEVAFGHSLGGTSRSDAAGAKKTRPFPTSGGVDSTTRTHRLGFGNDVLCHSTTRALTAGSNGHKVPGCWAQQKSSCSHSGVPATPFSTDKPTGLRGGKPFKGVRRWLSRVPWNGMLILREEGGRGRPFDLTFQIFRGRETGFAALAMLCLH